MNDSLKSRLLPILKYTKGAEPEALAELVSRSFRTRDNLFEADVRRLNTVTKSESVSELFLIIAALASRKSTESFKLGKSHGEEEIEAFLRGFYLNKSKESVVVISFDEADRVVGADMISDGTVNFASIIPRQIIEQLNVRGSDSFIMAHNHPSGVAEPSDADVTTTRQLAEALKACGIRFKEHYVVAHGECAKIKF